MNKIFTIALMLFSLKGLSKPIDIDKEAVDTSNGGEYVALSIGLEIMNVGTKAEYYGLDSSAVGLMMRGGARKNYLVGNIGFGFYSIGDGGAFSVTVQDQSGSIYDEQATTEALSVLGEVGLSTVASNDLIYWNLLLGYQTFSAKRSIDYCENCPSESLDLEGGMYIRPNVQLVTGADSSVSFHYQHFLSGDLDFSLAIEFVGRY